MLEDVPGATEYFRISCLNQDLSLPKGSQTCTDADASARQVILIDLLIVVKSVSLCLIEGAYAFVFMRFVGYCLSVLERFFNFDFAKILY